MEPKREIRSIQLTALGDDTVAADGPGSFDVYASVFYVLDDYDSMFLPGAFKNGLSRFLQCGFTANSHDWGYDGVIGYPVSADEDSHGLLCKSMFHSTEDAQMVRTKAMERMAAGKSVFSSVGFITLRDLWVNEASYADVLPKFIPIEKLAFVMAQIGDRECIRLIFEAELFEYSIVTAPSNRAAEVLEVRSQNNTENNPEAQPLAGVRYSDELIAARAAVDAVGAAVQRGREIHAKRHESRAGRTISAANRTALTEMHASMVTACADMQGHCETLKSFLDETAPADPKADAEALSSEARAAQAELLKQRLGLMRLNVTNMTGALT